MRKNDKFSQAAFRSVNGKVVGTGPFHNVDELPADFVVKDEGFLTKSGEFLTREQATKELEADHLVQSEELQLQKSLKDYTFEGPNEEGSQYRLTAKDTDGKVVGSVTFASRANSTRNHPHYGFHAIGQADVHPNHRGKGLYGRMLQLSSLFVKHHLRSKGLVSEGALRSESASGAWQKLLAQKKAGVLPGGEADAPDLRMSEKMDFLKVGESDPEKEDHEFIIMLRDWMAKNNKLRKNNSLDSFSNNLLHGVTDEDHATARSMLSFSDDIPEFRAASFMANGKSVSSEILREALLLWDHDMEMAALAAYGLPRTERNRTVLRQVMQMQSLTKNEMNIAALPRMVVPAVPEAQATANAIRRAVVEGHVKHVELGGKHSSGTAIARDPEDKKKYLIKPGSGDLSPCAGVNEQTASQSRREVAFAKAAEVLGLGSFVPKADLVTIDDQESAVMELVDSTFKDINKCRKLPSFQLAHVLEPYRQDGTLFKWAVMDMIFGNPDRHAGNVMIGPEGQVKLIDHGTSFAGFGFDPAQDSKSFIPVYLRAFSKENFRTLEPEERLEAMPRLDHVGQESFSHWIDSINVHELVKILTDYGILHDAVLARLEMIKSVDHDQRLEAVLEFWAGVVAQQS